VNDPTVTTRVTPYVLEEDAVRVLDQRFLPAQENWRVVRTAEEMADAIRTLAVRGAPLLGAMAAYGMWLGAVRARDGDRTHLDAAVAGARALLGRSRPTAVNLFHALERCDAALATAPGDPEARVAALKACADGVARADREACRALALHGARHLPDEGGVLTHCNAGALATCGVGTALGVIRAALALGKRLKVYADETRPLLQGARLTAWELMQDSIDVTILPDGAAAHLVWRGSIQAAVVGADRIARNGDVANKVGTSGVALACHRHGVPLWVAAPLTTVDPRTPDGRAIPIEERADDEVTGPPGGPPWAPTGVKVFNPAFDVTEASLVHGIITEVGVAQPVTPATLAALLAQAPAGTN
jgi:methylthioribose-1-phosphate isomerase